MVTPASSDKRPAFFKLLTASSDENSWLPIPIKFLQLYGPKIARNTKIVGPDDAAWTTIVRGFSMESVGFRDGWSNVVIAYGLRAGDLVVLRLQQDGSFRVEIFGGKTSVSRLIDVETTVPELVAEESPQQDEVVSKGKRGRPRKDLCSSHQVVVKAECLAEPEVSETKKRKMEKISSSSSSSPFSRRRRVTDEERRAAFERAGRFRSLNPFCLMVMRESHVYRGFWMGLKSDFGRTYLPDDTVEMVLLDEEGNRYPGKWLGKRANSGISGGWRKFSIDHGIEEGDVCIFELVDQNKRMPVMKVHIYRVVELEGNAAKRIKLTEYQLNGKDLVPVVIDHEERPGSSEDDGDSHKSTFISYKVARLIGRRKSRGLVECLVELEGTKGVRRLGNLQAEEDGCWWVPLTSLEKEDFQSFKFRL